MSTVNEQMIYEMFGEIYYREQLRPYTVTEISVTEAIQCLLKSFYQRMLRRALLEPKIVVLSFGKLVHEALGDPLVRRNYKINQEGKMELKDVTLYAHTDALASDHTLEFKTITAVPHNPLSHHVQQDNAYNFIFDRPSGYLVYIHKPSGMVRTFPVPRNEDMFQLTCLRSYRLSHCLRSRTLPVPEPSWLCTYCEYTDVCPSPAPKIRTRWL